MVSTIGFRNELNWIVDFGTLGVMRWQPLLWGGRETVFWAHLGPAAAIEFWSLVVLGGRLVYSDLTLTGAQAGLEAKNTEDVCMGSKSKPNQFQLSPRMCQMWGAIVRVIRGTTMYLMNVNGLLAPPLPHINRSFCFICSRLYAFRFCVVYLCVVWNHL